MEILNIINLSGQLIQTLNYLISQEYEYNDDCAIFIFQFRFPESTIIKNKHYKTHIYIYSDEKGHNWFKAKQILLFFKTAENGKCWSEFKKLKILHAKWKGNTVFLNLEQVLKISGVNERFQDFIFEIIKYVELVKAQFFFKMDICKMANSLKMEEDLEICQTSSQGDLHHHVLDISNKRVLLHCCLNVNRDCFFVLREIAALLFIDEDYIGKNYYVYIWENIIPETNRPRCLLSRDFFIDLDTFYQLIKIACVPHTLKALLMSNSFQHKHYIQRFKNELNFQVRKAMIQFLEELCL